MVWWMEGEGRVEYYNGFNMIVSEEASIHSSHETSAFGMAFVL